MLEVRVEHLGDSQFEIRARGHKLIRDQPIEAGGYNEGMTPPEFLLASLGSCPAYYAADYLKRQKRAVRAVERCLVHNTLLHPPAIEIAMQQEPALAVAS
jgi:putative redox protein